MLSFNRRTIFFVLLSYRYRMQCDRALVFQNEKDDQPWQFESLKIYPHS